MNSIEWLMLLCSFSIISFINSITLILPWSSWEVPPSFEHLSQLKIVLRLFVRFTIDETLPILQNSSNQFIIHWNFSDDWMFVLKIAFIFLQSVKKHIFTYSFNYGFENYNLPFTPLVGVHPQSCGSVTQFPSNFIFHCFFETIFEFAVKEIFKILRFESSQ